MAQMRLLSLVYLKEQSHLDRPLMEQHRLQNQSQRKN